MIKLLRQNRFLVVIFLVASFFYLYRLHGTFVMAGDTARDLIDVMQIWQNKEITVVGEPVNTISDNPIKVLFPSLHLYLGLLGLLITDFDPVGSVFVNIALTLSSIPFFFLLAKKILKNNNLALLSSLIYALSPVTVTLTRSYWEPNTVIPISVFVWYLFLYKNTKTRYFLAGFASGIVFNIHYMNFIPIALYIFLLLFKKDKRNFLLSSAGFFIAISPLIAFEIKNTFYLTKAFIGTFGGFSTFSKRTINPFISMDTLLYIFGLGPLQYFVPAQIEIPFNIRIIINSIVGVIFLKFLTIKQKYIKRDLVAVIILALLMSWYFEQSHIIALRYILSTLPLFVIAFVAVVKRLSIYISVALIVPMLLLSFNIVTHKLNPEVREDYYPVRKVEEISKAIIEDDSKGKYNVTENILGDARSLAFRFYLQRDAINKPQPVEVYDRIDTLYVITPSLEKTHHEGRWEFSASGPKSIVWVKDFGELKLYKFDVLSSK